MAFCSDCKEGELDQPERQNPKCCEPLQKQISPHSAVEEELEKEEKQLEEVREIEEEEEIEIDEVKALVQELNNENDKDMLQVTQRRRGLFVTAQEEREVVESHAGHDSCAARVIHFLHHPMFQAFLVCLLLVDVIVVIVELFIEAQYPDCVIIKRDAVSCCPMDSSVNLRRVTGIPEARESGEAPGWFSDIGLMEPSWDQRGRWLAGSSNEMTCPDANHAALVSSKATCDTHKYEALHTLHYILVSLSVFILVVFLWELTTLMFCLGLAFWKNPLYIADLFIVSTSLFLEFMLFHLHEQALIHVLLFARFWRFVRISHGLITSVHEPMQHKVKHVQTICEKLSKHMEKLTATNTKLENMIDELKQEIEATEKAQAEEVRNGKSGALTPESELLDGLIETSI